MGLFNVGDFTLHSGGRTRFKIDCDELPLSSLGAIADALVRRIATPYCAVLPVRSRDGTIAPAVRFLSGLLDKRIRKGAAHILIVDDVLTTGASMEEARQARAAPRLCIGAVVFARGPCPDWVTPLFTMVPEAP